MAAIVTGGAQGIGASICVALLKEGYKVCVADVQDDKGKKFVVEQQKVYGHENVVFSHCDVSKEEDYTRTFDLAVNAFESVSVLVNNAGISSERCPKTLMDINLMGPIIGCQIAMRYMGKSNGGKGGMVINTASVVGIEPFYRAPIYTASKQAVIGLTRSYGHAYYEEKEGLIFSALCPSMTDTDFLKRMKKQTPHSATSTSKGPGLLSPDYVVEAVVKLLKDRINGSALVVTKEHGYQYFNFQKYADCSVCVKGELES